MEEKILAKLKEDLMRAEELMQKNKSLAERVSYVKQKQYLLMWKIQETKAKYISELIEFVGGNEK